MADVREESLSSSTVRDLIFAYERHSSMIEPNEINEGRPRAKSIGNALSYKLFRQRDLVIHSLVDIEKELVKIEAHLNYYEEYEKETHVAFQEQLFNILTCIVSIDPEGHESTIQKKRNLVVETQKLAEVLNSKLPSDGSHSYRGVRRTTSNAVRREEAVVSTTSVRSQEHRAVLSPSQSTLGGGFKSEESLNSIKDSLDISSRHEDLSSSDISRMDETLASSPQDKEDIDSGSSYIPSVSKLKKFFSFRRDDKREVKVISAAYSGVSRSQSLNLKTSRYSVTKKDKKEEGKRKEEIIRENDEDAEHLNKQPILTSSPVQKKYETKNGSEQMDNVETSLYVEPVQEMHDYREIERETQQNVSVSKLKSLFEDKRKESDEGLGLLTKKQTEFSSDFNLPYTEANLGAFRLKRTISGNYMNFTGLLRNVDINKKVDLNKSKSMSDLKSENLSYYARKDIDYEDDLSKEIDDVDDIERASIKVEKDARELNNNIVKAESHTIAVSSIESQNGDAKYLEHRTIFPNPINRSQSGKPVVKVPIQLRTGIENVSHAENTIESKNGGSNIEIDGGENIKQSIVHNSIESTPAAVNRSDGSTDHSKYEKTDIETIENTEQVHTVEEKIASGTVETLKQTFEHLSSRNGVDTNEEIKHILHRTIEPVSSKSAEEPILKVPIQLRIGFSTVNHTEEQSVENTAEDEAQIPLDEKEYVAEDEQAKLKIPIQLRIGAGYTEVNQSHNNEVTAEENIASGTVETLKQTFERASSLSETTKDQSKGQGEIVTQAQLRVDGVDSRTHEVAESKEKATIGRTQVENRTGSYISITETPIEYSTLESNFSSEELSSSAVNAQENISVSSGTVEVLKRTFESLSRSNSQENSNETKLLINRTIDPEENLVASSDADESGLKVPIQLRTGVGNAEIIEDQGVATAVISHNEEISEANNQQVIFKKRALKVPAQLRINDGLVTDEAESIEKNTLSRAQIENTTSSLMNILESPIAHSAIVSGSSYSQEQHISSSSQVSVSYSQQKTMQHTSSTNVSHRIVSSSTSSHSSELFGQKYLQVPTEPNAYSILTSITPNAAVDEDAITITELENEQEGSLSVDLTLSQENILDELLKDGDSLENVDEEFEKMLQENR